MKTDRLPLLILALADISGLVYAVYGFARAGTFVLTFLAERVVVPAQLPLRLLDASPTVPVAETALAEQLAAPLPEFWQTDAVLALLVLAEAGKAVWVFYLVRRQK